MEQKNQKKDNKKNKSVSSSSTSLMFGKVKLTRAQKKLKKYKKSLKSIKNKNIRTNVIYLYELTKVNNRDLKEKYISDKALIYQKKLNLFVEYFNKIREIINTSDLNLINQNTIGYDKELYSNNGEDTSSKKSISKEIKSNKSNDKNESKNESKNENYNSKEIKSKNTSNNNKNDINDENNKENNSKYSSKKSKNDNGKDQNSEIDSRNKSINSNEKIDSVGPIKNFWKIALINSQFFYISKRDVAILNYLDDVIFIPLEYPNYRIEFYFKENEYTKQKILTKEYYYSNVKKEKLIRSLGCEIEWEEEGKNPTLKVSKKKLKEIENMKKIKNKKEQSIYVNCHSFFNMFDIDKCTIEKDFIEQCDSNLIADKVTPLRDVTENINVYFVRGCNLDNCNLTRKTYVKKYIEGISQIKNMEDIFEIAEFIK